MNPSTVDVNVHPAKLEVKFADERSVFEIVYYTIKNALEKHEYRPEMELAKPKAEKNYAGAFVPIGQDTKGEQLKMSVPTYIKQPTFDEPKEHTAPSSFTSYKPAEAKMESVQRPSVSYGGYSSGGASAKDLDKPLKVASGSTNFGSEMPKTSSQMTPKDSVELLRRYRESMEVKKPLDNKVPVIQVEDTPEYKFVGEVFDCYVMVEYEGALLVIDKHAAHERLLYNELKDINKWNNTTKGK